jgi:ribonucleoside-diphosphate reductase beta chain
VANNSSWPYRLITNPECRQYILRQGLRRGGTSAPRLPVPCLKSLWTKALIFNMYLYSKRREESQLGLLVHLPDLHPVRTGTVETDKLLRNLIAYYRALEGIFLPWLHPDPLHGCQGATR